MSQLVLKCFISKAKEPKLAYNENSFTLDNSFVFTVREFDLQKLFISEIKKVKGSIFNPIWVRAIFIIDSIDPTPFFVEEKYIGSLQTKLLRFYP
jgi:hypothetical protein